MGIQGPTDLKFALTNKGNVLLSPDYSSGTVLVKKVLKSGANEAVTRSWRFRVETVQNIRQRLEFTCVDFLTYAIRDSHYPRTPLVRDTFLTKNSAQDTEVCVPLPFGTCYIPLRPVWAGGSLGYLIGPATIGLSYTLSEVRSPRSWGAKSVWSSADHTFTDADETDPAGRDWKIIYPQIARSRAGLAAPDVTGIWQQGEQFLDVPTKFSRSDLAATTDPGDVLAYVLADTDDGMGLAAGDLNAASFAAASAVYAGWGLSWEGALWKHEPSERILARLLGMCHSVLDKGADLSLRPLSAVSQATITKEVVLGDRGKAEFTLSTTSKRNADGGYVNWQEAGEAQDAFYKPLVPVKEGSAPVRPGTETMECPWVQDSQIAQALATLRYQRLYLPAGECGFQTKLGIAGTYLEGLQTSDVATIDEADWGGTYDVLVDRVVHRRNGTLDFSCLLLSDTLDDIGDLAPGALVYDEPSAGNTWQGATTGPTVPSGMMPNESKGDLVLKAGANIILDGGAIKNNSRATDFEISEDVGIMGKGTGINMSTLMTSAYNSAPMQWFSEASFEEVTVTAPFAGSPTTKFYSDAFKQNVTGDLTVSAVEDLGDSWKITFAGAVLTENYQVGNLIEPDWSTPWVKYMSIIRNGTDWVEVLKTGLHTAPVATDTFSIHGIYANSIITWQQPYALWFTAGANVGDGALLGYAVGHTVDRATGLVELYSAMTENIAAGDRLKAYDFRVLFEYGWNNGRVILAPSSRCPGNLTMYLGAGGSHPGKQWYRIVARATNGIDLCPAYNTHDQLVRIVAGYPDGGSPTSRAHGEVTLGNFRVRDGVLIIKDGITEPSTEAGFLLIYVDVADGLLKVKYGDGTVRTLAIVGPT